MQFIHHACPNGIQNHIAGKFQQVLIFLNKYLPNTDHERHGRHNHGYDYFIAYPHRSTGVFSEIRRIQLSPTQFANDYPSDTGHETASLSKNKLAKISLAKSVCHHQVRYLHVGLLLRLSKKDACVFNFYRDCHASRAYLVLLDCKT